MQETKKSDLLKLYLTRTFKKLLYLLYFSLTNMILLCIALSIVIHGQNVKSESYSQPEYFSKIGQGAEKNYLLDDHGNTIFSLLKWHI